MTAAPICIGTPLRDAAVDPWPGDIGIHPNAGKPGPEGDPHGSHVIHAEVGSREYQRQIEAARTAQGEIR